MGDGRVGVFPPHPRAPGGRGCELSVVVPVRDAAATLREQLDALVAQEWARPFEVVIVDNNSRDTTRTLVMEYVAADGLVRLVEAAADIGVAYSRNVGIAAPRGRAVAICDGDDVVAPGWVAHMGAALANHELVAGRLDVDRLNPAWVVESRGRAIERGPYRFANLFEFAPGCNLGVQRQLIDRIGGFDQRYLGCEDIEFSFRAWRSGVSVHYEPEALVHYRYRHSIGALWHQARAYGRAHPALLDSVQAAGYPVGADGELRRWLWLARHAGSLRTKTGRAKWASVAGGVIGRLEGKAQRSKRHRVNHSFRPSDESSAPNIAGLL